MPFTCWIVDHHLAAGPVIKTTSNNSRTRIFKSHCWLASAPDALLRPRNHWLRSANPEFHCISPLPLGLLHHFPDFKIDLLHHCQKLLFAEYSLSTSNRIMASCETTWDMRSSTDETICLGSRAVAIRSSLRFYSVLPQPRYLNKPVPKFPHVGINLSISYRISATFPLWMILCISSNFSKLKGQVIFLNSPKNADSFIISSALP